MSAMPCVTVTPTIMDGTVVRWYASEHDLEFGGAVSPAISASRNGVIGGGFITPELFDAAWATHLAIKAGQDVDHLATHRRRGLTGPYVPVDAVPA